MNRIIKKITAVIAAAVMALSLAGCSEYVMTEEDLAVQKSLEGYWVADNSTGQNVFDEQGNLVSLFAAEFTSDYHYLTHTCLFTTDYTVSFPPVEYSIEEEMFKVVTEGVASYAKIEFSDDGQTMYWITDDKTETYFRIDAATAEELGIPKYDLKSWEESETVSGSDGSDGSGSVSESQSGSEGSESVSETSESADSTENTESTETTQE